MNSRDRSSLFVPEPFFRLAPGLVTRHADVLEQMRVEFRQVGESSALAPARDPGANCRNSLFRHSFRYFCQEAHGARRTMIGERACGAHRRYRHRLLGCGTGPAEKPVSIPPAALALNAWFL